MRFASLDSVSNEKIKQAVKLRESARYRRECGRFFLEGLRLCRDAAESEVHIFSLFFTLRASLSAASTPFVPVGPVNMIL